MFTILDTFLDGITMYKVVLYGLLLMSAWAVIGGFLSLLPYSELQYIFSLAVLLSVCWMSNYILAKLYHVPPNAESSLITALILFFVLSPIVAFSQIFIFLFAGIVSMLSKYVIAFHRKHLFNPAAAALVCVGLVGSSQISWWVGSSMMLPAVLVLGFFILRKIRRFTLFFSFLIAAIVVIMLFGTTLLLQVFISWPTIFFGTVMLTEPLTTPPTHRLRLYYGMVVGIFFGSQFHIGPLYSTPELALVIGNVFSYIVSSKQKLLLALSEKRQIAADMYEFVFTSKGNFAYRPGEYMEWTLPHENVDFRGNRRYFTIASSPTENTIRLGVKILPGGSSFKKKLVSLNEKATILAGQLAGDFTLPKDVNRKLVFLAGGIGITPFRSMVKYLLDTKKKRDIVMLYSNKTADEIVYKDVFDQAEKQLAIKTIYTLTDTKHLPKEWKGEKGRVDAGMIQRYIPDYKQRMYYISGPHPMVTAYEDILKNLGISSSHIIIDYFPGFV